MLYAPLTSPMRATVRAHLILFDLITLTILGEDYKPCSSSLCSFLQSHVTSSLLGPNILLSTVQFQEISHNSPLNWITHWGWAPWRWRQQAPLNIGKLLPDCMMQQPRRQSSSSTDLLKLKKKTLN
jgi:hypothetical protein